MVRNTSHLSVFVPEHLREALELSARLHDRSLSGEVRQILWSYIGRDQSAGVLASPGTSIPKQQRS
jgi:plasmid stability protein